MNKPSSQNKKTDQIPSYMTRVNHLKNRVILTRPEMDLENASLLTEGFIKSEGEPLVVRKAKAFRIQCQKKSVKIC